MGWPPEGPAGWALCPQASTWGTHSLDSGPHLFAAAPLDFKIVSSAGWDFVGRSQLPSAIIRSSHIFSRKGTSASPRGQGGPELGLGCQDSVLQACRLAEEPKATCVGFLVVDFCFLYSLPPSPHPRPCRALAPSCTTIPERCRRLLPGQPVILGLRVPISWKSYRVHRAAFPGTSPQAEQGRNPRNQTPDPLRSSGLCQEWG